MSEELQLKPDDVVELLNVGSAHVLDYAGNKIFVAGERYRVRCTLDGNLVAIVSGNHTCHVHMNQVSLVAKGGSDA